MFDFWWHGNKNEKIRPYRFIQKKHDLCTRDHMAYTRLNKVMNHLDGIVSSNNMLPIGVSNIDSLPIKESDDLFNKAYIAF